MKGLRDVLRALLPLLPAGARRYLVQFSVISMLLALLDTVAVGVIALMLQPMMLDKPMRLPLLGEIPKDRYALMILLAALLMIVKSLLNIAQQWRSTYRFGDFEMGVGNDLFLAYMRAPWTQRMRRSSAELSRIADVGIANAIGGVVVPTAALPTELMTFVTVMAVLVVAQPVTALTTFLYLGVVAAILYLWISRRALVAGRVNRDASFRMSTLMTEMVSSLKEITLRDKSLEVAQVVDRTRRDVVRSRANTRLLAAVPKYVIDMALVGGFLLIGGVEWVRSGGNMTQAFSAIAIFGIAGFKIVPSITRIQSLMTTIQTNTPYTWTVIDDIHEAQRYAAMKEQIGSKPIAGRPRLLSLRDIDFTYPGREEPAVRDIDLDLPMGSSLALVGSSGAGKSTLVDILLGLLEPTSGTMTLDGVPLVEVLADWRTRVGYVPQDVTLFDGTIAQNVALTWGEEIDEERVRRALERAHLLDVVEARPGGIHARVGERGLTLSGGQRQRLGIARALYVEPLILVLDEATSALDSGTEEAITSAIREMHGDVTVIAVAHRLSTIRHSDQVCFMKDATIAAKGTFDEVVAADPDFAYQARLAGLA